MHSAKGSRMIVDVRSPYERRVRQALGDDGLRTALDRGVDIFAIYEGYQGMVDGGDFIRRMSWVSVGSLSPGQPRYSS